MPVGGRTQRDVRRRRLGQNFLAPELADQLVEGAAVAPGELVVEIGPGRGALTAALLRRGAQVVAVEADPVWAQRLRAGAGTSGGRPSASRSGHGSLRVIEADFLEWPLPVRPFRVVGNLPFGATTDICRRLFEPGGTAITRADLIVQWEVARKRARTPPTTLLSAAWAPWWEFELGRRLPASAFRPVPVVDAGVLVARRRVPAVLPDALAPAFASWLRREWPPPGP